MPVSDATVRFKATQVPGVNGDELVDTDAQGRFSLKILKDVPGELHADFFAHSGRTASIVGEYDYGNCPQVQSIIKQTGEQQIKTPVLEA